MLTIARLTFREMLNKKVLLLGLTLTVIYLGLYALGLHYLRKELNEVNDLVRMFTAGQLLTAGLFVSGIMISAITIFSSVGTISSEIENGIMLATASKALKRSQIFLGKFMGLGILLTLFSFTVFAATSLIIKITFDFTSGSLLTAMGVFVLQPWLLLAVTMWGSAFLSTLGTGILVFMLYSLSVIGGIVEQIGVQLSSLPAAVTAGATVAGSSLTSIGIVSSLLMPTDSLYRLANFLLLEGSAVPAQIMSFNPFSTSTPPSVWMLVYSAVYILIFVGIGLSLFSNRDI